MGIPNEAMYGDDRADSMPHVMPVHLTSPSANLDSHMNSYVGGKLAVAVPPNKVLPAVPLSKQQMFPRVKTLAPKKPDGLHQVSALLDSIKSIYTEADRHDAMLTTTDQDGSSALASAKATYEAAQAKVDLLKRAEEANTTLTIQMAILKAKEGLLREKNRREGRTGEGGWHAQDSSDEADWAHKRDTQGRG